MIFESVEELILDNIFFKANSYCECLDIYLKIEGFNFPGSIKLKPAKYMIQEAEASGLLNKNSKIIESSSGNLGVALSHICASKKYPFICVTDVKACPENIEIMKALGAEVVIIEQLDNNHGYVEKRLEYINARMKSDPSIVWLNQYSNPQNVLSHYEMTADALLNEFNIIDYLFIGAGTSGTLMGCIKKFKLISPQTIIIAVDFKGSINFSNAPCKRYLSGIGSSRKPEILDVSLINDMILVDELDAVRHCKSLAKRYGILSGASTGAALAAIASFSPHFKSSDTVVTLSPDLGRGYLDTVYNQAWIEKTFDAVI